MGVASSAQVAALQAQVNAISGTAVPGGSDKQIQYNNAGGFGGISNGTATHVLTSNGAGSAPSFQALPSSSGNTTSSTAVGSEPGSPTTGDLDLYSNGYAIARWSGAAWPTWGPLFPLTNPSISAPTTWVNQGGASVDTTNGGIYLLGPKGATFNVRGRAKTAPATPYTITAAFLSNLLSVNTQGFGLNFRESSSGKMTGISVEGNSGGSLLYIYNKYTSSTATTTSYGSVGTYLHGPLVWLRITDNGTNRICSVSADGQHWVQVHTIGRTDFLTADQVMFYVYDLTNTYDVGVTLVSWQET